MIAPAWARGYRREWLRFDLVAGVVTWSVVTFQALRLRAGRGPAAQAALPAARRDARLRADLEILRRAGVAQRLRVGGTLDEAVD